MAKTETLQDVLADHALERAQQAATLGRFGEAERYLAEVRKLVPRSHHIPLLTAKIRLRECRFDECREALSEARRLGHHPEENASMSAWLEEHVAQRAEDARHGEILQEASSKRWSEAPELRRLGTTRDALSVVSALRRYLLSRPNCPVGLARLAEALTTKALHWGGSSHVLSAAESAALRAVSIAPGLANGHAALGYVYEVEGSETDAERHFRQAISRDPRHWLAHYALGVILTRQGRHEHAVRLLTVALEQRPDFIAAYDPAYQARCGLGDLDGAAELASVGIARGQARCKVVQSDLFAHACVGLLSGRLGDQEAANRAVRALTERFPKSGCAWAHAGLTHAVLGDGGRVREALGLARERGFAVDYLTRRSEFDWIRAELNSP